MIAFQPISKLTNDKLTAIRHDGLPDVKNPWAHGARSFQTTHRPHTALAGPKLRCQDVRILPSMGQGCTNASTAVTSDGQTTIPFLFPPNENLNAPDVEHLSCAC